MSYTPNKDLRMTGTERLTNLTANSGGTIDLSPASAVNVPTVAGTTDSDTSAASTAFVQAVVGALSTTVASTYATITQLNDAVAGLDQKASVRLATAASFAITGRTATTLTLGGTTLTVDGVAAANGDRILVKNAPTGTGAGAWDQGIYTVGGIGTSVVLTRATDADSWTELPGAIVAVEVGTANADTAWMITADQGGTLGTTAVTVTSFGAGTTYTADGSYITLPGNVITASVPSSGTGLVTLGTAQTILGTKTFNGSQNFTGGIVSTWGSTGFGVGVQIQRSSDTGPRLSFTNDGSLLWGNGGGTNGLLWTMTSSILATLTGGTVDASGLTDFKVPTAAIGDNDTSAASTAFVQQNKRAMALVTVVNASFPYTITASSGIPSADTVICQQSVAQSVNLPAASAVTAGTEIVIKDDGTTGAGTHNITINRAGADTIEGLTTYVLDTNREAVRLQSDGSSKWYAV